MKPQPQPTRRHLLTTLGAAAGSIVLRPLCLQAADAPPRTLSFIVITDTHRGKGDSLSAEKLWQKTAAEVTSAPGSFVLHLGDIVDGMREPQYPIYLEARKQIQKPVHEIPGNHDKPEDFQKHIRPEVDTFVDHEWLRVVLLNNAHNDSHLGFFTAKQIAWLGKTCDDAAQRGLSILLCAHVPLHENLHPDRGWYVKPADGQTEFYAVVKKHEFRVLALFHGHFHNGIRGWDDRAPVHEILFPSALYNQDRNLEDKKAPGYNLPEFRPGYTLVSIKDGAMTLQYRVTGTDEKAEKVLKLAAV